MAASSFKKTEYPMPQGEVAKELAPYFQAIISAQSAILEQMGYSLDGDGEPSERADIEDRFIGMVNAAVIRARRG
jgi:hypothetical protein